MLFKLSLTSPFFFSSQCVDQHRGLHLRESLVNKLAETLAQAEVEALGEGKAEEEAGAKVDTLAEKLRKWQVNAFDELLSLVETYVQQRH